MIKFPDHFLWGSATSSYQVEGDNKNADWWPWEKRVGHVPSGQACRHYQLYTQDFDIIKSLHHNAHRLSIEWSRIEPKEGMFDQKEIDHYAQVIWALKDRGIEPIVTLHHFTNPLWLSNDGGWVNKKVIDRFLRYSEVMAKALGPLVCYWNTINEPSIYFSHSYMFGWWPPQEKNLFNAKRVHDNMLQAHVKAYRRIHQIYAGMKLDFPKVSIAHHMMDFVACKESWLNNLAVEMRHKWMNFEIIDSLIKQNSLDYIGLNYYSRQLVDVKGIGFGNLFGDVCKEGHHPVKKNFLGWDIYPQGLRNVLVRLKKYNLPIIITENGICTNDDNERWEFIKAHLKAIDEALALGVDVRGYLYWSLMDNFEWDKGYKPRFGLIDINYETQERIIRDSAKKYALVCQSGELM